MKIQFNSIEWKLLILKLKACQTKSNRDSFCVKCWAVIPYKMMKAHKIQNIGHDESILTTKYFCSEKKFIELAKQF